MVREVGLTDGVKARNCSLEVVVNPDTAHGIVDGRVNHHRLLPWRRSSDLLVHLEEVSVSLLYSLVAETLDSILEIEEHGQTGLIDTLALLALYISGAGSHVTRNEVTECRISALEIVIPVLLRYL